MIRRLILRWQIDRALAKRRRARKAYRAAGLRGSASAIHNAYGRDALIRAAGLVL